MIVWRREVRNMEFQNVFTDLRKKEGLSQNDAADRLFVTRQAVSRWERGETVPEAETLLWHCPGCSEFPLTPCLAAPERWCVRAAECR